MTEFARVMRFETPLDQRPVTGSVPRINVSDDDIKSGLGRLVLARLLHDLLECQAIRRMDSGTQGDRVKQS